MEQYTKLIERIAEIGHINSTMAVLGWDQQTYMPAGGSAERANQLTVLSRLAHEMLTSDTTAKLLAGAESECADLPAESDQRLALRVVRREFDQSVKLPGELVAEIAKSTTLAHEIWVKARQESNFAHFAPTLTHLLDLARQVADHLGHDNNRYDALLDLYEPNMKTHEVTRAFDELKSGLVPLVKAIADAPPIDDSVLRREYSDDGQRAFGEIVIKRLGYDTERGRLDVAVHPFCTSFGRNDVRITTRYEKNWLPAALMGSIHETGHALYEQGFDASDDDTPLSGAASLGFHESQSRLWENIVGRSRGFWNIFYGDLQSQFPNALGDVEQESFYRAINRVSPSFIRVEADEVTYPLHIMLRFELEQSLLSGKLAVADLPDAWNAGMESYLGITPTSDADGCLQDVHWSGASFGYFPTYALGSMLASQLYEKAIADNPMIVDDLARGEYWSLLHWLRENVHRPGRRHFPAELTQRICGKPASGEPYLRYLNAKYGELYGLS